MAINDETDGDLNLPGLQIARDLYDIYFRALQGQTNTWGNAWKAIKSGNYQGKDLIRSLAVAHERHQEAVDELLRYPVTRSIQSNMPSWTVIDIPVSDITGPFERRAKTRAFPQEANLIATELAPFGSAKISFKMLPIQDTHDLSSITVRLEGWYEGPNETFYSFDDPADLRRLSESTYTGQYLGMVYDSRQRTEPPLLVVTLRLKGKASGTPNVDEEFAGS